MRIRTRRRRSARAARLLVNILSLLLTLAAGAFLVPTAFGYERYAITGTSMTGTIDRGSVVFGEVVPVSELRLGDVITYRPPPTSDVEEMVTHRIVEIDGDMFRTKGDAVPEPDPWEFKLDQPIQARVAYVVPYVGYVFIALADRETRIAVIGIPAGLIALVNLGQFILGIRERLRRRKDAGPCAVSGDRGRPVGASC